MGIINSVMLSFDEFLITEAKHKSKRNYVDYINRVDAALNGLSYKKIVLGSTKYGNIYLFKAKTNKGKAILAVSGQHGEEPAGPWALLKGIEQNIDFLKNNSVSFVCIANPHGFTTGIRNGQDGGKTNWVLNDDGKMIDKLGLEIKILVDNIKLLKQCAKDGLINLHEDITSKGFYLYILGNAKHKAVKTMLAAGKKWFDTKKDGEYTDNGNYVLKNGIIDNHKDGTIDNYLLNLGVPFLVTTETPAENSIKFEDRVNAGADLFKAFVNNI